MMAALGSLVREITYAARSLRKTPAFAAGAIVTVAMTVGATSAIFSVVYGVLLRQLPYRQPERVFWIWSDQPGRDRAPFNVPDFVDIRDSTRTVAGFAGYFQYSANLTDDATPERVQGLRATGNLFAVLGVRSVSGRLLEPRDEAAGEDHVVVLGERFWRQRFGGDPAIVGTSIRLDGDPHTVVGIMPAAFAVPIRDVDIVVPFAPDRDPRRGARNSVNFIHGAGRLADGVSRAQADDELTAIARRLQQQFPVENARKRGIRTVAMLDGVAGAVRSALLTIFAAVAALLLIAAANLANLMLTRATARRKEVAVQLALGASRAHVVRQVLLESLLVAGCGGALGVLCAHWGVSALVALAPADLPRAADIRLDGAVLMFSLAVSAVTAVLFGAGPALVSAGTDVRDALQASRGATAGGRRLRAVLVAAEVSLAVAVLIVMTMLARSFANVQSVAPGFEPSRVLSARLTLPIKRFNTRARIATFERTIAERLRTLPTVAAVGAVTSLPLSGLLTRVPFTIDGKAMERERVPSAQFRVASPGYFEAMRIPVVRGRTFSDADTADTRPVAVVNDALAQQWFGGGDAIGRRLLVDDNDGPPRPIEIVGVVGNVQQIALDGQTTWDIYLPYAQIHPDFTGAAAANMFVVVRATGDSAGLASVLAAEVRKVDSEVVAAQIRPLDRYLGDSIAPRRFSVSLIAAFALAAFALAVTGIYSVSAYAVAQRARELSIRMALGATAGGITRLVVGQGSRSIAGGVAAGVALAALASRLLGTLLFGVAPLDAPTFAAVPLAVVAASLVACAVPAARARRLRPGALNRD